MQEHYQSLGILLLTSARHYQMSHTVGGLPTNPTTKEPHPHAQRCSTLTLNSIAQVLDLLKPLADSTPQCHR